MAENNTEKKDMEPIPNQIPAEIRIVRNSSSHGGEEIERMISQVINLNSKNVVHEPTCPICSSPYCDELGQKYLENSSDVNLTRKQMKDKYGDAFNFDLSVIRNHLTMHAESATRELQKVEYASRIKRLYNNNLTTLDWIQANLAFNAERIIAINSLMPNGDQSLADIEKIKSDATAKHTAQSHNFLKLQASIMGEMKDEGDLIKIPTQEFTSLYVNALDSAKTDGERKILRDLFAKIEIICKKFN